MSNLSFARIMYGSNEDSAVSTWMHSSSPHAQLSNSLAPTGVSTQNWMHRLLSVVLPNHGSHSAGSDRRDS